MFRFLVLALALFSLLQDCFTCVNLGESCRSRSDCCGDNLYCSANLVCSSIGIAGTTFPSIG